MRGTMGKKGEEARSGRCLRALFRRINIIIARDSVVAVKERETRREGEERDSRLCTPYKHEKVPRSPEADRRPRDGYVRSFLTVFGLPGGKEGYGTEFAG